MKIIKSFKSKKRSGDHYDLYYGVDEENCLYCSLDKKFWSLAGAIIDLNLEDCAEIMKHFEFLMVFK